jgi:CheY-like chemotaxis protein
MGMSPELLSRVFNLFEQGDASVSRFRGGLGIGLTLVKRIMEMHGGSVTATSQGESHGSEFVIRLPISAASYANARPGPFALKQVSTSLGRRILVVDDNVDAAQSVERLLRSWGHDVQTAFNGPQALEKAGTFRPQIILLDIGMPGMSGYEVARHLRERHEFEGVVITALTGYGQVEDRRRSREAGINHHLTKPPDPAALAALLSLPESHAGNYGMN